MRRWLQMLKRTIKMYKKEKHRNSQAKEKTPILRKVENRIRYAQFNFDGWQEEGLALLVNPFFFIRRNLYKNVRCFASLLSGCVLDFGCGSKPYRKLFSHASQYVGCDILVSGHSHEQKEVDVYYDGETLPFENESFDNVFSSEVFEHIFNLDVILSELNRILKRGGMFLCTVPFVWNEHEIPFDCARYTSYGMKDLLERHGFEIIEMRKSTLYVETMFQMFIEYLRYECRKFVKNRYLIFLLQVFCLMPITIVGIVTNKILPQNDSLYCNNVILCRKV